MEEDVRDGRGDEWVAAGWATPGGQITDKGWSQLNDDISAIERNCVRYLSDIFDSARDEGHSHDDLVGTLWVDTADQDQIDEIDDGEFINDTERVLRIPDMVSNDRQFYKGVSDIGLIISIQISYFGLPEEITDLL